MIKLAELCLPYLIDAALVNKNNVNMDFIKKTISLYQERLKKLSEIAELTDFFFRENLEYDKNLLKWNEMAEKEVRESLEKSEKLLSEIKEGEWAKEILQNILMPEAEKMENKGKLLWPLRAALSGKQASAGPFEIAEVLGKEKTLKRIKDAKENL